VCELKFQRFSQNMKRNNENPLSNQSIILILSAQHKNQLIEL